MEVVVVYFVHWDILLRLNRSLMGWKVMLMNVSGVPRVNTPTSRAFPSANPAQHPNTKIKLEVHPAPIAFLENITIRK
jgi:hypothetical protein